MKIQLKLKWDFNTHLHAITQSDTPNSKKKIFVVLEHL